MVDDLVKCRYLVVSIGLFDPTLVYMAFYFEEESRVSSARESAQCHSEKASSCAKVRSLGLLVKLSRHEENVSHHVTTAFRRCFNVCPGSAKTCGDEKAT